MATILRREANVGSDAAAQPATFTFSDMASQGEDYVRTVQAQAAQAVQQANAEAAKVRKRAEAEGKAAAEASLADVLQQRVGEQLQTLRPALEGVVTELQSAKGEWQEHWRNSAVGLAVAIAERIVRRELKSDPTIGEQWLTEALELAAGASEITVRLAPGDMDHLRDHAEKLAESMAGLGEARFVADAAMSPGGCRVETRHGVIDQQLETQLERLAEELS